MKSKKIFSIIVSLMVISAVGIVGVVGKNSDSNSTFASSTTTGTTTKTTPKYVFLFIGDGMSQVQINAAQVYLGSENNENIDVTRLGFTQFPVSGNSTTQDSTSFCPDSASTATSIATGYKTHSGVIGLASDKTTKLESIAEKMKNKNYKVGIVSSVTLDHATPAAFYANVESRSKLYDIGLQLADSNFDYLAGGSLVMPTGKYGTDENIFKILESKGYTIADKENEISSLNSDSGKVYAVSPTLQDSNSIPYSIDTEEGSLELKDYVKKGIEVLENEDGFFIMTEAGKIDWACHANDGKTAINEVIAFDEAINEAVKFYNERPDETLIIVTGDHETGGLSIGNSTTGYNTAFSILSKQKTSYVAFNEYLTKYKEENKGNESLEDLMVYIKENFGLITKDDVDTENEEYKNLVLSDYEYEKVKNAFNETLKNPEDRTVDEEASLLYGSYEPLSVTITHILNNKAGIGWTSYSHTGVPVPVYAMGVGSENFNGSYDNTDIYTKLASLVNVE